MTTMTPTATATTTEVPPTREVDEDIPTIDTTPPITRSCAKQIHDQVNANLSLSFDLENMVVPSPPFLLVEFRRNIEEDQPQFSPCKTMFYDKETKSGVHEEISYLLKKLCSGTGETIFWMSLATPTCERFPELEFAAEETLFQLQRTMFGWEQPTTPYGRTLEATTLIPKAGSDSHPKLVSFHT